MTMPPASTPASTPGPSSSPSSTPASAGSPAGGGGKGAAGFKDTLNLPQTAFAMKANLVQNEPASIKRWAGMKLYERVRAARAGRERFVLHDGPPYANGSIHMGHLMNKVLKDLVVRSRTMAGFDCPFVPGWDCHGLPIEHKVLGELAEKGKLAKLQTLAPDARRAAVRRDCQAYAAKFHALHTQQFGRLMTLADYDAPYLTMQPEFEAGVLEVLATLLERGLVFRALKPVHWSIANETALAEAELEYEDRQDPSVYVDFEAADAEAVYSAFGLAAGAGGDDTESDEEDADADAGDAPAGASAAPRAGVRPRQTPCFMIWTTTPWTLPANVAIAVNPKFEYALAWVDGNVTVLAVELLERVMQKARAEEVVVLARTSGSKLVGLGYRHPFVEASASVEAAQAGGQGQGLDASKVFTLVGADYVTLEDGTGLVHTAPGHGVEDHATGLREGLPVYCPVRGDGTYDDSAPAWLRGVDVWKANTLVVQRLRESGHMFHDHLFTHSYPHDGRSKTPTIFRCTQQWFVGVDRPFGVPDDPVDPSPATLRQRAFEFVDFEHGSRAQVRETLRHAPERLAVTGERFLRAEGVKFVPEWGANRLAGMLESRPDWCISRQRAWGLPIPAFTDRDEQGRERTFMTPASVRAVAAVLAARGSDAWFSLSPAELLAGYDPSSDPDPAARAMTPQRLAGLGKGGDILDVWFESGSSWQSVLRARGLGYPADLYLEGSDQHRGWFQLSMLPALGVTGRPPFRTVLTHGFMVDKDGRKLSKSKGDAIDDLFARHGADVLRWWVCSLSYENDVKVDDAFFELAGESYRKVRNTLRFLLSNLSDFTPTGAGAPGHCVPLEALAPASLEAWVMSAFAGLVERVRGAYDRFDFRAAHAAIYGFCTDELSSTYLAAVKDRLYCDEPGSPRRRATQTVLFDLADGLSRLLAPVLVHTADEAWRALWRIGPEDAARCVHLEEFPCAPAVKADAGWPMVMALRDEALRAIEQAKATLGVDNPLDMGVTLGAGGEGDRAGLVRFDPVDLADLLGVSRVNVDPQATGVTVRDLRDQPRCERSWRRDGTVRERTLADGRRAMLSDRDARALGV